MPKGVGEEVLPIGTNGWSFFFFTTSQGSVKWHCHTHKGCANTPLFFCRFLFNELQLAGGMTHFSKRLETQHKMSSVTMGTWSDLRNKSSRRLKDSQPDLGWVPSAHSCSCWIRLKIELQLWLWLFSKLSMPWGLNSVKHHKKQAV